MEHDTSHGGRVRAFDLARGLWLVWLGYLLNVLRGTLPATLAIEVGVVSQPEIEPSAPWWLLSTVDGWSGRVIAMYFAHWLIVTWTIGLIGFRSLSLEAVLVGMAVAVALTAHVSRPRPRLAGLAWIHAPWTMLGRRPEAAADRLTGPRPARP